MPGNFTFVQYERTSYILYVFKKKKCKIPFTHARKGAQMQMH